MAPGVPALWERLRAMLLFYEIFSAYQFGGFEGVLQGCGFLTEPSGSKEE
jgi:hypothetical protein